MKKIILTTLMVFSISSYADVYWGVGYGNISDEDDGDELSLGALELTVGNRVNENFAFEFTLAQGIQDDKLYGADVELETNYYGKALYYFNDNIFINAFWGRLEAEVCYQGTCVSTGDTEGGFGIGADFPLQNDSAIRLSYDNVDDADIVSLKYIF